MNLCAICRLVGGYPEQPCTIKVQDTKGLTPPEKQALSKALHHEAAAHAESGEVCAFNVVDTCQVRLCSILHLHWLSPLCLQNVSSPLRPYLAIQYATSTQEKCNYVLSVVCRRYYASTMSRIGISHVRMRLPPRCGTPCSRDSAPAPAAARRLSKAPLRATLPGGRTAPGTSLILAMLLAGQQHGT